MFSEQAGGQLSSACISWCRGTSDNRNKANPTNFSTKATSGAIAHEVQSRICANNSLKKSVKRNEASKLLYLSRGNKKPQYPAFSEYKPLTDSGGFVLSHRFRIRMRTRQGNLIHFRTGSALVCRNLRTLCGNVHSRVQICCRNFRAGANQG
ncbi:hypothetical protein T265_03700 [Opisthorchis viverrini]|uniref:Uncharacterized protein n=1 Tax=Opisthorchis viverrini TaxID=6198 RepID=A0A074ZQV4_OPIVI|nr:hypothetical protein T265_03700 [Opisthorchis viverrini]KER29793.1 hypothetical protein T265_03700 [Opisthorchis viverrini]